jgi:DNA-nicking Smr family endonuclease
MPRSNDTVPARDDRLLWREAVRSVTPLPGREAAASPSPAHTPPLHAPAAPAAPGPAVQPERLPGLDRFSGIDRANAERLKRGLHPIESRLDLHGMTQTEAHRALAAFVHQSRDAGRRCVLVITGRGFGPNGPGVLKLAVPRWLEEPRLRRQILAIAPARSQDGGAGALYVLLRRHRAEPTP